MKITIDLVEQILKHEKLFRPRSIYCILLDITDDTIRNWIKKGEKLYRIDQGLFKIPTDIEEMKARKNYSNNELLIFLYDQSRKLKVSSMLDSFDSMLETGTKGATKSFGAKTILLEHPEKILEVVQIMTSDFQNNPNGKPPTGDIYYDQKYLEKLAGTGKQHEEE